MARRTRMIKRLSRGIGLALLALVILLSGLWCSIAVWFQSGAGTLERGLLAGSIVILTVVLVGAVATSRRWLAGLVYAGLFAAFLGWWSTIAPSSDRIWAPDVDRTVTATIDGDRLTVTNVRNFTWRAN